MRYLLQFPAGATALVRRALAGDRADARVRQADDSALVFDSGTRLRTADGMGYAKNAFVVHAETPRRALPAAVGSLAAALPPRIRPAGARGGFRVRYHVDGRLIAVEPRAGRALEVAVARSTGLRLARRGGGHEFWVVGRRGWPVLYLGERLPRSETGPPARGALSPELSTLLVAASEPAAGDVFLDPFAGSGALVAVRLRSPARRVIYNDLRPPQPRERLLATFTGRVVLHAEDALSLPSIRAGSVDAIVTDPPWGEHDRDLGDYPIFAAAMSSSFARVLRPATGRAVVLVTRRREATVAAALTAASLTVLDRFPLLVNGHPASAVRAHR